MTPGSIKLPITKENDYLLILNEDASYERDEMNDLY